MTAKQPAETLQPRKQLLPAKKLQAKPKKKESSPTFPQPQTTAETRSTSSSGNSAPGWGTVRQCRDIYSEGITGEAINDAVYNRNIKIEDAYKVKIALEMMDLDKISTAISQEVNGGTNTYDVMYPRLYDAPSLYQKAYFHNIKKIPNIDLEKPWWDSELR